MAALETDRRAQTVSENALRFQALLKPDGEILEIDRQALAFWGLSESAVKGRRFWEIGWRLIHDEQAARLKAAVETAGAGRTVRREAAVWDKAHQPVALSLSLRPIRDSRGDVVLVVANAFNLSRRPPSEASSGPADAAPPPAFAGRALAALEALPEAVLLSDATNRIDFITPAAAAALGRPPEELLGEPLETVLGPLGDLPERCRHLPPGHALPASFTPPGDSAAMRLHARCSAIRGAGGGLLVALQTPVDAAGEQARDGLTGLLNRGGLLAQLERVPAGPNDVHTLCYLDIDGFEQINLRYGRERADQLLRRLAADLRNHARQGDLAARIEGDDFALLLRDCAVANARSVADSLIHAVHDLSIDDDHAQPEQVTVSIGIAPVGPDARAWLSEAREACLQAKEAGGNQVAVYHRRRNGGGPEAALRWLFEQGRVQLYLQPLVELDGGAQPGHAELLLRVLDDEGRPGAPAALFHGAANAELLPQIDRWVIDTVFAHGAQAALTDTVPSAGLSINLAPATLADADLLPFLRERRDGYGLDPARIGFELPESAALADPSVIRALMGALRDEGFAVTLDDCGSSLSLLRNLPVDYLKIGGPLIAALLDDPVDHVLIDSINRVAHLSAARTVAKWVENDATVKRLRALQVDYGQGFGLAEPMPLWQVSAN